MTHDTRRRCERTGGTRHIERATLPACRLPMPARRYRRVFESARETARESAKQSDSAEA